MKFDHSSLTQWFKKEQRDLPWRDNPSPYAVWVSEIMLQQTQVAVVIPYFLRWMEQFPNVQALAESPLESVIKCWEGLGYYTRARSLHAGAKYLMEYCGGVLPSSNEELAKIPGIGPYTLGAIQSFAFKIKAPAVDGNVMRVLSRYFLIEDDFSKPKTVKKIWAIASDIMPGNESWVFNEALIELGATICTRNPKCNSCPLNNTCKGYMEGKALELPFKSKKTVFENLYRAVAVIESEDKLLVQRVQEGQLMSGLHEFPYFDTETKGISSQDLENLLQQSTGLKLAHQGDLEEVSHSFTRYRVRLSPVSFFCSTPSPVAGYEWKCRNELDKLSFSSGHRRIYNTLNCRKK